MDCIQVITGILKSPNNKTMKKLFEVVVFCCCIQLANSQNIENNVKRNNFISSKEMNLIFDTTPAVIPSDYYDFCECTEISNLANIYTFEDVYRKPFTNKIPTKYLLCSLGQLDSIGVWSKDSSLYLIHMKVSVYETFFSPYYLNYWTPNEDVLTSDDFFADFRTIYDSILSRIEFEKSKKAETKDVNIVIVPKELTFLKNALNGLQSNLFLLRVNDSDKDNIIAYQFFTEGEFDISSLYTPLQYYKYLRARYMYYYHLRDSSK